MKQLIVSVLLLLVATFVFSQADIDSQEENTTKEALIEQQGLEEKSLANLLE
ncbi:hypothetical protein ACJOV8_009285 [Formosa sp. 3Alg 14/1]|uniref:hypothetical protein n=1 Tax=unclassified Formosa TaxID=2644710 RepID=UPI0039BDC3EF